MISTRSIIAAFVVARHSSSVNDVLARERAAIAERLKVAAEKLFREGAILTITSGTGPILVGHFEWLADDRLFVFVAYGDAPKDAHILRFDQIQLVGGTIRLAREDRTIAELSRIEDSLVDDPNDYRIAWQLWQQVAPLRRELIERCYEALVGEEQ